MSMEDEKTWIFHTDDFGSHEEPVTGKIVLDEEDAEELDISDDELEKARVNMLFSKESFDELNSLAQILEQIKEMRKLAVEYLQNDENAINILSEVDQELLLKILAGECFYNWLKNASERDRLEDQKSVVCAQKGKTFELFKNIGLPEDSIGFIDAGFVKVLEKLSEDIQKSRGETEKTRKVWDKKRKQGYSVYRFISKDKKIINLGQAQDIIEEILKTNLALVLKSALSKAVTRELGIREAIDRSLVLELTKQFGDGTFSFAGLNFEEILDFLKFIFENTNIKIIGNDGSPLNHESYIGILETVKGFVLDEDDDNMGLIKNLLIGITNKYGLRDAIKKALKID